MSILPDNTSSSAPSSIGTSLLVGRVSGILERVYAGTCGLLNTPSRVKRELGISEMNLEADTSEIIEDTKNKTAIVIKITVLTTFDESMIDKGYIKVIKLYY